MDKLTKGYYHCRECGALFEAEVKEPGKQKCVSCGALLVGDSVSEAGDEPALFRRKLEKYHGKARELHNDEVRAGVRVEPSSFRKGNHEHVRRKKRSKKKSSKGVLVVVGWLVLLAGLAFYFKPSGEEVESEVANKNKEQERELEVKNEETNKAIQEVLPICEGVMRSFFKADSASAKSQFVDRGIQLAGTMNRYYRAALDFSHRDDRFKPVRADLLSGFKSETLGVLFLNDKDELWETIFVKGDEGWKIDWEALVRYDDRSWALFPAARDGEIGEFRLYMRVRDTRDDLEQKEITLEFYKPDMFVKGAFHGVASEPVSVAIDSDLGRQIKAILKKNKEQEEQGARKDAHGLSLSNFDPKGYHRVRVRMKVHKLVGDKKKSKLELLKILANDWYGIESVDRVPHS